MSASMKRYRRLHGESGVVAYDSGDDWIRVQFVEGSLYTYTYASAGPIRIEQMKQLANAGQGLSSFISRHVRDKYATRSEPDET